MSSFTQTIDLSTLQRRLAQESRAEGGRVDFEPRLYGRPRPPADDGDRGGTQTISRRPPRPGRDGTGRDYRDPDTAYLGRGYARPDAPPGGPRWSEPDRYDDGLRGLDDRGSGDRRLDDRRLDDRGLDDVAHLGTGGWAVPAQGAGAGLDDLSGPHPAAEAELGEFGSNRSKALWTIVDQIASAASNAAINFLVARQVTASEFGAFAIGFTVFALMVGFARASASGPLGIRYADASPSVFRSAARAATGASLVLGIIGGGLLVAIGGFLSGAVGENLVAVGIVLPALLTQDAWRYAFFAQGRPAAATANDTVWVVVMAIGIYFVIESGSHSAIPMVLAWGGAAAVAALFGIVQTGTWPAPARVLEWFSVHRDIVGYMSGEYVTVQGAQQASTLLVAGLGSTALVGALRGAQTLLGPTSNVATALVSFAVPEFARRRAMPAAKKVRAAYGLSITVIAVGTVWGLFFMLLPPSIGHSLLGNTWSDTRHILLLSIVQQSGPAFAVGPAAVLYALGRARNTFQIHALLSPLLILCPLVGLYAGGVVGVVLGYIVAFYLTAPFWWLQLRRAAREADEELAAEAAASGDRELRPDSA